MNPLVNSNPSLTSYAFKVLYHLIQSNGLSVEYIFASRFKTAYKNIKYLVDNDVGPIAHNKKRYIKLLTNTYNEKTNEIKSTIDGNNTYFEKNSGVIRSLEIQNKSSLGMYKLQQKTGLPIYDSEGMDTVIYDGESLSNFIKR